MDNIIKFLMQDSLTRNIKHFEVEGTEDKIRKIYI